MSVLSDFLNTQLPTRRDEAWKYTRFDALREIEFSKPKPSPSTQSLYKNDKNAICLVFQNGQLQFNNADLNLPKGLSIDIINAPSVLPTHFVAPQFVELNQQQAADRIHIQLAKNTIIEQPLYIIHHTQANIAPFAAHPQVLLTLNEGSQLSLIEHFVGEANAVYWQNAITVGEVGKNARLKYYKCQQESPAAFHIANTHFTLQCDASIIAQQIALGARVGRDDLTLNFLGEGANADILGFYDVDGKRHYDAHTWCLHRAEHTESHQQYRGILRDHATGVFNGKILVEAAAQDTHAHLTNRNLVLGAQAQMNTKPELEIYADNVQCSHGATVGQLDERALFYLRSRGIPEADARALLTQAFSKAILSKLDSCLMDLIDLNGSDEHVC